MVLSHEPLTKEPFDWFVEFGVKETLLTKSLWKGEEGDNTSPVLELNK